VLSGEQGSGKWGGGGGGRGAGGAQESSGEGGESRTSHLLIAYCLLYLLLTPRGAGAWPRARQGVPTPYPRRPHLRPPITASKRG
jgi:hypothetical protein